VVNIVTPAENTDSYNSVAGMILGAAAMGIFDQVTSISTVPSFENSVVDVQEESSLSAFDTDSFLDDD
jgi:hypothetical protein